MSVFYDYFTQIKQAGTQGTEHTYRTPFENFLNAIKPDEAIKITHEPERQRGFGAPDFRIERNGAIIGYIETKKLHESLDNTLKSPQLKKYLTFVNNLILTNYHEFILIKDYEILERASLFSVNDLEKPQAKLHEELLQKLQQLFQKFFLAEPLKIGTAELLAVHLAERGKILKDYLDDIFKEKEDTSDFSKKMKQLYEMFKHTLVKDLTQEDFADAYAQTVIYGLFLARLQSSASIDLYDASRLIPSSFKVIQELFSFISIDFSMPSHVRWIFQEIINVINHLDLAGIVQTLSFHSEQPQAEEEQIDPYLYFYETFLGEFDPHKRKAKGVYYTPVQVVSFITKSIQAMLQQSFGKKTGFADPSVTVLDFAAGTGTFLVSIFELVLAKIDRGSKKSVIQEHLLRHFYGFEYLVAPYAIAHLKLSQLLKDYQYEMSQQERLQIYLTDTLDDAKHEPLYFFPAISNEGEIATQIKDTHPILVITGNPPYNNRSTGKRIEGLMESYKPEGEKKLNFNDDYLKFIRFAHEKIVENTEQGIIGIITNNSFLNGLTHRAMRGALLRDFDEIYILNLHGNARLEETCPDGSVDQNVFDIMQGVAISLFVRKSKRTPHCRVFYYDLYGKRDKKYQFLREHTYSSVPWEELKVETFDKAFKQTRWGRERFREPLNFFVPIRNEHTIKIYGEWWGFADIFSVFGSGIQTKRDDFTVQFEKSVFKNIYSDCQRLDDEDFRKKYHISPDSAGWNLAQAKRILNNTTFNEQCIRAYHYRPFDKRLTYFTKEQGFLGRPRYETMQHFLNDANIGLCFIRNDYGADDFTYIFVVDTIIDIHLLGGQTYIAPFYLHNQPIDNHDDLFLNGANGAPKVVNFTPVFTRFIKAQYAQQPSAKEIFSYIYAILHSQHYRKTYLEFLKIDFPRIPFVKDYAAFKRFSVLGQELIDMHLMKTSSPDETVSFPQEGTDIVETVRFVEGSDAIGRIYINKTQYFDQIPLDIWRCHIGGYQVVDKWLKSRKDRVLSYQEKEMLKEIILILKFTCQQMRRIDEAWQEVM